MTRQYETKIAKNISLHLYTK